MSLSYPGYTGYWLPVTGDWWLVVTGCSLPLWPMTVDALVATNKRTSDPLQQQHFWVSNYSNTSSPLFVHICHSVSFNMSFVMFALIVCPGSFTHNNRWQRMSNETKGASEYSLVFLSPANLQVWRVPHTQSHLLSDSHSDKMYTKRQKRQVTLARLFALAQLHKSNVSSALRCEVSLFPCPSQLLLLLKLTLTATGGCEWSVSTSHWASLASHLQVKGSRAVGPSY